MVRACVQTTAMIQPPWVHHADFDTIRVPRKITPQSVIELRTSFWQHVAKSNYPMDSPGGSVFASKGRDLLAAWSRSDVILWDDETYDVAGRGVEVFEGERHEAVCPEPASQLWFSRGGLAFHGFIERETSKQTYEYFRLEPGPYMVPSVYVINSAQGMCVILPFINPKTCTVKLWADFSASPVRAPVSDYIARLKFLTTTIADVSIHRPERGVAKHWARQNVEIPTIKTVVLRRTETNATTGGHSSPRSVQWSHRWLVSPHWALRACGKERSERRQVFIDGYIKGPEDAPLVPKDTVFVARR